MGRVHEIKVILTEIFNPNVAVGTDFETGLLLYLIPVNPNIRFRQCNYSEGQALNAFIGSDSGLLFFVFLSSSS